MGEKAPWPDLTTKHKGDLIMKKTLATLAMASLLALAVGCTATQQGAGVGAAIGAGAGAIIGHNTHAGSGAGALIGGAVGGLGGALAGDAIGRHQEHERWQDRRINESYYDNGPRRQSSPPSYYPDNYR